MNEPSFSRSLSFFFCALDIALSNWTTTTNPFVTQKKTLLVKQLTSKSSTNIESLTALGGNSLESLLMECVGCCRVWHNVTLQFPLPILFHNFLVEFLLLFGFVNAFVEQRI
jgi:hypothetical protein